ncbi:MAG: hypothetical protein N2C14_29535, partial [Planctomycetales bacterium]
VPVERFAAAALPSIGPLPKGQPWQRVAAMASRLRELETRRESILCVCSLLDWPWIRQAYTERIDPRVEDDEIEEIQTHAPDPNTLLFMLGELPFITGLHERARAELEDDENLSIDGVKELLLVARDRYREDLKKRARRITPQMLSLYLRYARNLSLIERRMTPDLYTLVIAAKQIAGDMFALHVAETARDYPHDGFTPFEPITLGIDQGRLPDGEVVNLVSRLPGPPVMWRGCDLKRRPEKQDQDRWAHRWNPFGQCSWPPEDDLIERFRSSVQDRAKAILGADLARTEKFTTSIKDGIDVRETVRNWHTGEIHVKIFPPARGNLDCAVMLFDHPADPRDYPWRTTWYAEHDQESTLAFFATDFRQELVGPGVCLANYGGAMFLFPPRKIPDIWTDRQLDFVDTMEERLLAAACLHSQEAHIALLSSKPPNAAWRRMASRFHKKWVHVPLAQFSASNVAQLRLVHVLNGHEVRSYAADFIRKA